MRSVDGIENCQVSGIFRRIIGFIIKVPECRLGCELPCRTIATWQSRAFLCQLRNGSVGHKELVTFLLHRGAELLCLFRRGSDTFTGTGAADGDVISVTGAFEKTNRRFSEIVQ
jgi:hypothetical protein